MPSNYRYPGKSDFEAQTPAGQMSDVNAGSLYREAKEGDLLGSTDAKFSQFIQTSKTKMQNDYAAMSRMADDHSIYDTSGK